MTPGAGRGPALLVMAKEPRPGRVKTRMTPPLEPAQAAELYGHLLDDVLEASAFAARRLGLSPFLSFHPAEAMSSFSGRVPTPFQVVAQRGADLGARMAWAVAEAAAAGFGPILLRGSDSPALGESLLAEALDALGGADVVVSADPDGGYNLVGVHVPNAGLFGHRMSVSSSLQGLCDVAVALGLRVQHLESGFDLDTVADLSWLARARARGDTLPCPRTLGYLDAHDLWRWTRDAG